MTWKRFPHNWPLRRGIHRSPVDSSGKGKEPVTWRFDFFFVVSLNKLFCKQPTSLFETPWRSHDVAAMCQYHDFIMDNVFNINSREGQIVHVLVHLDLSCFSIRHKNLQTCGLFLVRITHDDVINWKHFRVTRPLCGEFTGPGEFPTQRPVTRSFDVFFDLRLNKQLSKQPWGWWFETPSWSLWRQCNAMIRTHKEQSFDWLFSRISDYTNYKYSMKLLIHSQTAQPLRFGNG